MVTGDETVTPANWRTYLVTQESLSAGRTTTEIVDAAIAGGVDVVQLREKGRPIRERYELARSLRARTAEAGVPLVVNDRIDLAMAVDADGVHLGQSDLPVSCARDLLDDDATVGCSAATVEEAVAAERAGADYLGTGSVYGTTSKDVESDRERIGPEGIAAVVDAVSIPVIAIGGLTHENASAVIDAGASGVAVVSEITMADDPKAATETLRDAVTSG